MVSKSLLIYYPFFTIELFLQGIIKLEIMMNKFIVPGIIVIAVIALITVIFVSQNKPTPKPQPQQQTIQPTERQKTTPLSIKLGMAAQNSSGESGTAILTALDNGKTKVELKLNGAPQGIVQPSHIHTGSCASLGAVLYPLKFPVNGVSETILDVDLTADILNKLPLALNVHKSVSEAKVYVACSDINTQGSGSQTITPNASITIENRQGGNGPFPTGADKRRGADKPEN